MIKRTVVLLLCGLSFLAAPVHADITTGLVARWRMNEGTGTTTADDSGNANNCTFVNTPTWNTTTMQVGAAALQFLETDQDAVTCGNGSTLNPTAAITLAGWIRPTDATPTAVGAIVSKIDPGVNVQFTVQMRTTAVIRCTFPAGTKTGATTISDNTWAHFACTWDGSNVRLYINGTLDGSAVAGTTAMSNSGTPVRIGCDQNTTQLCFGGGVDHLHMYNRALSAGDVVELRDNTEVVVTTAKRRPLVY